MRKKDFLVLSIFLLMLPFVVYKLYLTIHISNDAIIIQDGYKTNTISIEPTNIDGIVEYWNDKAYQISVYTGIVSALLMKLVGFIYYRLNSKGKIIH